jgi:hypothetical protein
VTVTETPLPAPPVIPSIWTPSTIIAYAAALALFVMGLLTFAGVVLPANASTDVTTWSAAAESFAGAITALVTTLSHHSLAKSLAQYER